MIAPAIVVSGLGRCGSSATMQMLSAAGVPCVGSFPDFETEASSIEGFRPDDFAALRGRAIKILDPHRLPIPAGHGALAIWLTRDHREQARSMLKMAAAGGVGVRRDRQAVRALAAGIARDRMPALAALGVRRGLDRLDLTFEQLVGDPAGTALAVSRFLFDRGGWDLDPARMAAAIVPRSPACLPGMLEALLARRAA